MIYICNSISPQMMTSTDMNYSIHEITEEQFYEAIESKETWSCVGHRDLANILGVAYNRESIKVRDGDYLLIAQLNNGRLPKGATSLPEDMVLKFYCVRISKSMPLFSEGNYYDEIISEEVF